MHVIATAGHVDHGKSTLVRALTGTDPDRLDEEKERGLTIDLGFAFSTLPSGKNYRLLTFRAIFDLSRTCSPGWEASMLVFS